MLPSQDLSRLSRLLDEALALAPARREAWLAALPAEAAHLAGPLRDMLAREAGMLEDGRLRTLPRLGGWEGEDATSAHSGDRIGPYRLIEEIGRGGMGSVWRAERADGSYQREVALKLPRLTWGQGLARLMAQERDIGAMLEHPNIARLYDAGVDLRGWPYLALELVDGRPIDAWCHERGLGVAEKLALLLQIMRAVGYAHGRLVVHRDIKPSNVLVTPDGQVRLLDFGIARLLGDATAGQTEDGARRLTPHYASPEQLRGEPVTVATDVYSLGVLAFELLTGQTPYPLARPSRAAWEEAVLDGEPERASARCSDRATARALRGDLDAILAKALKRDPAQRYASVDAFAQDLERHLRGEPVLAQPDRPWYRLGRALRRHRVALATAAAVLAALAIGGGLALRSAQRAELAAQRQRIVTGFAAALLRADQAAFFARKDSRHPTPELTLADSAALIQQRFPGDPELQAELLGAVARMFLDMDQPRLAADHARRQVEALQRADAPPEALAAAQLLTAESLLAGSQWADGDAAAREALKRAGRDRVLRAEALALIAQAAWSAGDPPSAQASLRELEALLPQLPASSAAPARALALRAEMAEQQGKFSEADADFERGIALALHAQGEGATLLHGLRQRAARSLMDRGRTQAAAPLIDAEVRSLNLRGGLGAIEARVVQAEFALARYEQGLATHAEALQAAESAQGLIEAQPTPPENLRLRLNLARTELAFRHGDVQPAYKFLHASFGWTWEGPTLQPQHWRRLSWTAHDVYAAAVGSPAGDWREGEYWSKRIRDGKMPRPDTPGDVGRIALGLAADGHAKDALVKLEVPAPTPAAAALLAWVRAQILLDQGRPGDATMAVQGMPLSPSKDLAPEHFSPTAVAAQLDCAQGRAAAGRDKLAAEAEVLLRDRNPAAPRPAWLRAHAGLCALAAGDPAGARALAAQARQAFTAQPDVAAYYKQPLQALEAALQRR